MWPFKSKIPNVERIFTEDDGELITIIHDKGAHKFRREEIIELKLESDVFSPKVNYIETDGHTLLFWLINTFVNSHLSSKTGGFISFFIFGGFVNLFSAIFFDSAESRIFHFYFDIRVWLFSFALTLVTFLFFVFIKKKIQLNTDIEQALVFNSVLIDVMTIKLNNTVIKIRLGRDQLNYPHGFFKDKIRKIQNNEHPFESNWFSLVWILSAGVLFYLFYKVPFWFLTPFRISDLGIENYYSGHHGAFGMLFLHGVVSNILIIPVLFCTITLILYFILFGVWPIGYFSKFIGKTQTKNSVFEHIAAIIAFSLILYFNYTITSNQLTSIILVGLMIVLYAVRSVLIKMSILGGGREIIFLLVIPFWIIFLLTFGKYVSGIESLFLRRLYFVPLYAATLLRMFYLAPNFFEYKLKKTDSIYFRLYKNHKPSVKRWLKDRPLLLKDLPEKWSESYEMVQIALRVNPEAFQYACQEIKSDQEFIKEEIIYVQDKYKYSSSGKMKESDQKTIEILSGYLRVS